MAAYCLFDNPRIDDRQKPERPEVDEFAMNSRRIREGEASGGPLSRCKVLSPSPSAIPKTLQVSGSGQAAKCTFGSHNGRFPV
jgi:hypothetical protein